MAHFLRTEPNRTEPNRTEPLLAELPSAACRRRADAKQNPFRLTPLLAALLLAYPAMQARHAQAADATANTLPDLGNASERTGSLTPKHNGITLDNRSDGKRLVVSPEYSDQTGLSLGGIFAFPLGDSAAAGLVFTAGDRKNELLFNAGFQMDDAQRLILTLGQQRQHLDIGFISGSEKAAMTQTSAAASYQFRLEQGLLNGAEINAYIADTPSRDLADKSYALDTATLYESWNDPRRVAGGRVTGLQARLAFTPMPGGIFKLGLGGEKQEYDHLAGKQSTTRSTGSAEWSQQLESGYQINAGADAAVQNRYTLGLSRPFGDGWLFGINFVGIRSRDGAPDDNQIKLTWSYDFGGKRTTSGNGGSAAPAWGSLLDQVARHPGFLPAQVVARLDTTAAPARLIAVDKTALPAGTSIDTASGIVTSPLGVAVTGIAGVTLNGAPFGNSGQFSLSGNNLVIDPGKITQPAVGVIDIYVVTIANTGGGATLATVRVSHGSVKIDSITLANGDTAAPATTGAPAISGTTDTATTLTATLNEAGTGYYLVQAAAMSAPSVATIVAANQSFAMPANIPASVSITGLAAATAYKIYFVAKDAANNVQAAVQSVAVTTTAAPDTTAPTTTAGPSVFGTTDTATTLSATIDENGTGYYLVQAAAAAAPTVAAVQAGTSFAMTANVAATPAISGLTASTAYKIYFVAKDAANNVQAAVQSVAVTTTTAPDTTPPVAAADSTTTPFNTAKAGIDVLANDTDNSGAAPTLTGVLTNPVGGSFAVNAGKIDFTPTPGFSGAASVTYEIEDGRNNKATGILTVTVEEDTLPPPSDTTAPVTTVAPALSVAATDTTASVTQTINENGTGYYLVQAAAAAAPSAAAVMAGTSFAMTAGTPAAVSLTGLSPSTAYKYYFVAKDSTNNAQAAVSAGLAITTTATPDTTAPTTTAGPSVSGTTSTGTTLSVTLDENGTGYYLVQAFAAAAPNVAAVQAGTSFAMTANVAATPAIGGLAASTAYKIYFVAKDAANNVQAAVQSVDVTTIATPDTTAPTTSAGPSVSGTTDTGTTLSATINENGTGYYLVQAFAAAAPNVAAVQAGTSFAMTANVAATPAIGGLTASTAYKIYFVAKDAANNVQAAVQSVAVTTTATPDTAPPVTSSAPAISVAATDTTASVTQTINENGTGYYLVLPAADAIPTVAAVKAGTSFAMTANTPAAVSLTGLTPSTAYQYYFVAKDAANNDQAAVSVGLAITTTATPDTTAPTTSAGPSVSGTTETGTTLSVTINENGTGYYLVQAFAAAAPNVAAVQAGTSFAMTANVAATPAIGGLAAGTAYKVYFVAKDAANNVQAAVQSVAVTTNTAPTANNFTYGTNIDNTAKTFDWKVLSAAADADGDALTATVQAQGAKGAFVVAGDNVTYTPSADQTVSDSGTLRISDGRGGVKDIVVTVNGIDTQPPAAPALVGAWVGNYPLVGFDNAGQGTLSTPPDADLAAWYLSESTTAPASGAAGWFGAKPSTYIFFPTPPGSGSTATLCVYVKDTLGNVQQTGACESYLVP